MDALLASRSFHRAARCAGCAVVLAMLIPGAGHAQQRCEPPAARLVSLQGTVELQLAGTNVWTPATLGQALCLGDALRVGRASRAALALANDSTLRLDERTTLQLRGVAEEQRSLIDLILGGVYFFSHRPRALEVDTPFVNAAAEGTEFLVRVGAERAEVVMLDGRVLLRNPQGELRVASGDAALIPAGEAPRPMVVARPRDAVAWALYYPPILTDARRQGRTAPPVAARAAGRGRARGRQRLRRRAGRARRPSPKRRAMRATIPTVAGVLLNVGRTEEAEAAIERALALDPEAGDALAQRAIIQVVQNRQAEALADARRALELSPDSAAAAIALSYALQAAFQLEEAREVLRASGRAQSGGRAGLGAPRRARADVRRSPRIQKRRRAGGRPRPRSGAHADGAGLRGADPDRHQRGQGRVRARDRAGFGEPAAASRPGSCHHPQRRSGRGRQGDRDRRGARSERLADPQLSRQDVLRGAARSLGRRAVRDRQGARPERPDALVLRRDPPADREPPGRGAAQPREVDRAEQ